MSSISSKHIVSFLGAALLALCAQVEDSLPIDVVGMGIQRADSAARAHVFSAGLTQKQRQDSTLYLIIDYLGGECRYHEALEVAEALLPRLTGNGDDPLKSETLNLMAIAYFRLGNLEEATHYLRLCYETDLKIGDQATLSSDLNQLAAYSLQMGRYDLAQEYILEAIKIELPLKRDDVLAIRYGLASEIYLKLDKASTARDYAQMALEIERVAGREAKVGIRLSQLAAINIADGRHGLAREELEEAVTKLSEAGNETSLAITYCQLGELATHQNKSEAARKYYEKALAICARTGSKYTEKRALYGLWNSLKKIDPERSALFLERYAALSDSLVSVEANNNLNDLKVRYATRELLINNERLAAQNRHKTILIALISAVGALIFLVAWLLMRNRLERQRQLRKNESARLIEEYNQLKEKYQSVLESGLTATENNGTELSACDRDFIGNLVNVVYTMTNGGQKADLTSVADALNMTMRTFSRKVQAVTGETPATYINRIKIDKAKHLIDKDADLSLADVAFKCGFDDPAYFSRMFKQMTDVSPTAYKRRVR